MTSINLTPFFCEYDGCNLIYQENLVTLPCGSSMCQRHLNERFECPFCFKEHQLSLTNKEINETIKLDPMRKKIKDTFDNLNESIKKYQDIESDVYIYNYFYEIRNKVDLHREELKKEIDDKSEEIIQQLKVKEEKCKSNAQKIIKINLNELKNDTLQTFKQKFKVPIIDLDELNNFLSKMNQNIQDIKYYIKKYKVDLLLNESIKFNKYERSSLFGELRIKSGGLLLSKSCQTIQNYDQHTNTIRSIKVDEIHNKLITGSHDATIKIWDLETGECKKTLLDHKVSVQSVLILPNNKFISGSLDKTIKIWDFNSYECLNTLENESGVCSLSLISDNQIACGCLNGFIVIWNLDNSTKVKTFKAHNSWITYLIVNTNKSKSISCSVDCKIKIWNLEIFECIKLLEGHSDVVNYLELTLDGNLLSCSVDMTIKLWQTETGELLKSCEFKHIISCVQTLNDDLIAVALLNGQIQIYDLSIMKHIKYIEADDPTGIYRLCFLSSRGNMLSGSNEGEIKLWNIFD